MIPPPDANLPSPWVRPVQVVFVVLGGGTMLLLGVVVTIVFIPIGLGILGREFAWARRLTEKEQILAERLGLWREKIWSRRRLKRQAAGEGLEISDEGRVYQAGAANLAAAEKNKASAIPVESRP